MTKQRPYGSEYEAIVRVGAVLGFERAAHLIDRSPSYLRQCADPDQDKRLKAYEAAILDRAVRAVTGEAPLTEWLTRSTSAVRRDSPSVDLCDAMLTLHAATGRAAAAIRDAKAPTGPGGHRITARERVSIDNELMVVERKVAEMRRELHGGDVVALTA